MFALHATAFLRPRAKNYGGRGSETIRFRTNVKRLTQSSSTSHQKRVHAVPAPRRMFHKNINFPSKAHTWSTITTSFFSTRLPVDRQATPHRRRIRRLVRILAPHQTGVHQSAVGSTFRNATPPVFHCPQKKLILTKLSTQRNYCRTTSAPVIFPVGYVVFLPQPRTFP